MTAQITPIRTHAETDLVEAYGRARDALPGNAAARALRAGAFALFSNQGLPHRRIEAWHYTDLRNLMREALPLAPPPSGELIDALGVELAYVAPAVEGFPALRLVIVDGVFVAALSQLSRLPRGIAVTSLADALTAGDAGFLEALGAPGFGGGDAVFALNAALMQGGVVIDVEAGGILGEAIEIVSVSSGSVPQAVFSRSLVRLKEAAALTLVERHVRHGHVRHDRAVHQSNSALILSLADHARLDHIAVSTRTDAEALALSSLTAGLGSGAELSSFAYVAGGGLMRRQVFVRFDGAGAKARFSGVSLLKDSDHADTTLVVEHVAPACQSREFFKHIVDGEATGVFQGKVIVAPGAQKSDGGMKSHAILLSDQATMNNKPELEIFADDVICGHGATTGELDEAQLFYAQSRGLPRAEAEAMLIEAFAGEAVERVGNEILREWLMSDVRAWLEGRRL